MKVYKTIGILDFSWGLFLLTEHQAAARAHALKQVDDVDLEDLEIDPEALLLFDEDSIDGLGLYETLRPVQFKVGEVFGYAGQLDAVRRELLQPAAVTPVADETVETDDDPSDEALQHDAFIIRLQGVIGELEDNNPDHWTESGKPEVKALKAKTGEKVSAADRDEAWAAYRKQREQ